MAGLALPLLPPFPASGAGALDVAFDGDNLHPVIQNVHFLAGRPLERLKDGETVVFGARLSLFTTGSNLPVSAISQQFAVSYDVWDERFKVVIPGSKRSKKGMTAPEAEAWCIDSLQISPAGVAAGVPFYLRLELRTASARDTSGSGAESGLSWRAFMDLFLRKAGPEDPRWGPYESRPLRLSDLVRTPGRGTRG